MPKYEKYLKDVVPNKKQLIYLKSMAHIEECNSRVMRKLPKKLKDPRTFTLSIKVSEGEAM